MPGETLEHLRASGHQAPGSDELLRLMIEGATDYAIFSIDRLGSVTSWNSGAERVLGYRAADIVGKSADVIFVPEERERGVPEGERTLASHSGRAADERWQLRANGTRFWASGLMLPLADAALGYVKILRDQTELHLADQRLLMLLGELQHRTRNLLAVVQSIATQTARRSASLHDFELEFNTRLQALSRVQALATRQHRPEVELRELVDLELKAHGDGEVQADKVRVEGPSLVLPAEIAMVLSMGLHELATNAVKYGALRQAKARLSVRWRVEESGGKPVLALEWREVGVRLPPFGPGPRRKGYDTELIERALPYQLGASTDLHFTDDGVICRIAAPLATREYKYET